MPGAGGGSIFGGWLISRFSLSCARILRAQVVLTSCVVLTALAFLIWCDNIAIAGVTIPYNNRWVRQGRFRAGQTGHYVLVRNVDVVSRRTLTSVMAVDDAACFSSCACADVAFTPACHVASDVQYFSPCHAGCLNYSVLDEGSKVRT